MKARFLKTYLFISFFALDFIHSSLIPLWAQQSLILSKNLELTLKFESLQKIRKKYERSVQASYMLSTLSLRPGLAEDPLHKGYFSDSRIILNQLLNYYYEEDPESRALKEKIASEALEIFNEDDLKIHPAQLQDLLNTLSTFNGSKLLSKILSKEMDVPFETKLSLILDFLSYSPAQSFLSQKSLLINYLENIFHWSQVKNETDSMKVCGTVAKNPFPILREKLLSLTATPFRLGPYTYLLAKNNEEKLLLIVLNTQGETKIVWQEELASMSTGQFITYNSGRCPHKIRVSENPLYLDFNFEGGRGKIRLDGRIYNLSSYEDHPNDVEEYQLLMNPLLGALSDENNLAEKLSAIRALFIVHTFLQTSEYKNKILSMATNLYENNIGNHLGAAALDVVIKLQAGSLSKLVEWIQKDKKDRLILKRAISDLYQLEKNWPHEIDPLFNSSSEDLKIFIISVVGYGAGAKKGITQIGIDKLKESLNDSSALVRMAVVKGFGGPAQGELIAPILRDILFSPNQSLALKNEALRSLLAKHHQALEFLKKEGSKLENKLLKDNEDRVLMIFVNELAFALNISHDENATLRLNKIETVLNLMSQYHNMGLKTKMFMEKMILLTNFSVNEGEKIIILETYLRLHPDGDKNIYERRTISTTEEQLTLNEIPRSENYAKNETEENEEVDVLEQQRLENQEYKRSIVESMNANLLSLESVLNKIFELGYKITDEKDQFSQFMRKVWRLIINENTFLKLELLKGNSAQDNLRRQYEQQFIDSITHLCQFLETNSSEYFRDFKNILKNLLSEFDLDESDENNKLEKNNLDLTKIDELLSREKQAKNKIEQNQFIERKLQEFTQGQGNVVDRLERLQNLQKELFRRSSMSEYHLSTIQRSVTQEIEALQKEASKAKEEFKAYFEQDGIITQQEEEVLGRLSETLRALEPAGVNSSKAETLLEKKENGLMARAAMGVTLSELSRALFNMKSVEEKMKNELRSSSENYRQHQQRELSDIENKLIELNQELAVPQNGTAQNGIEGKQRQLAQAAQVQEQESLDNFKQRKDQNAIDKLQQSIDSLEQMRGQQSQNLELSEQAQERKLEEQRKELEKKLKEMAQESLNELSQAIQDREKKIKKDQEQNQDQDQDQNQNQNQGSQESSQKQLEEKAKDLLEKAEMLKQLGAPISKQDMDKVMEEIKRINSQSSSQHFQQESMNSLKKDINQLANKMGLPAPFPSDSENNENGNGGPPKDKKEQNNPNSGGAANDSTLPNNDSQNSEGDPSEKQNQSMTNPSWGDLPDKEREEALQFLREQFPSRYREVIEAYFRALATQDNGIEKKK